MMVTSKIPVLSASVVIILFVFNTPVTAAANLDHYAGYTPASTADKPYAFVNKFCNGRSTSESREFCFQVLKSDPRSAGAKNILDLLFIALDAAVGNLRPTHNYLEARRKKGADTALRAALRQCTSDYKTAVVDLRVAPKELPDDPSLVNYDVGVGYDAMKHCTDVLTAKNITDAAILSRHKISLKYFALADDVATLVN